MRYYSAREAGVTAASQCSTLSVGSDMPPPPVTTTGSFPAHDSGPGAQTNVTLTFTPSTLRNIEDTFLEASTSVARPPVAHQHQAGFVTPHVAEVFSPLSQHRWQGGLTTVNSGEAFLSPVREHPRLVPQPGHNRGGRRPKDDAVPPEEELRRRQRRERNKQAAARCRRRRLDLINTLQDETDELERRRRGLEREIQHLQAEREELSFLMQAHRGTCSVGVADGLRQHTSTHQQFAEDVKVVVKPEPVDVEMADRSRATTSRASLSTPPPLPPPSTGGSRPRPTTLPTTSRVSSVHVAVPITTPSQGLGLNFDSMMDGGTGLTPVAPPVAMLPVCSSTLATPVVTSHGDLRRDELLSPDASNRRFTSL